ncbi:hypothetical protein SAMN04515672_1895 [Natronorubrum texcoconense]|uniref:Pilin/flagellin n=1 Tax=Natronorubrum texcoconense TaxID=1095776 RepID=A0A1G8XVP6_9EURY|nr:hypothetical protein SAMN04515672_1895 [Natronorubrum texcoconense]
MSLSLRDRGQTTQDFIVGIGVFILAVAFVFSFLPTMLTPFDSSTSGGQTAQADRVADRLVHNLSDGTANEIDGNQLENYDDDHNVSKALGLRTNQDGDPIQRVNVSLQPLNESTTVKGFGPEYDDQSAASSARIVTVEDGPDDCDPACRLVVRIW